jgi:hypothetical protein
MPTTIPTTTSTARGSLTPNAGDAYFETDTKNYIIYDGANWRGYNSDGITFNFSGSNTHSGVFDGSADWVVVGTVGDLNTSSDFSFTAWFNLDGTPSNESLMGAGSGSTSNRVWIAINNSTSIRIGVGNAFDDFTVSTLTTNGTQWYHLAATVSGTTATLYLDGSSVGSATCSSPTSTAFNDLRLGALNGTGSFGGNTNPFGGYLDEMSIFNRAITSTEVSNIYNNKVYVGPTAMYRLDNDVTDETGNYDGTNNGVTFDASEKPY